MDEPFKIKTVMVELGMTIPLPNYSNIKPSVALEAEVTDEETDLGKVHSALHEKAKTLLMRQCWDLGADMRKILEAGLDDYLKSFFDFEES